MIYLAGGSCSIILARKTVCDEMFYNIGIWFNEAGK